MCPQLSMNGMFESHCAGDGSDKRDQFWVSRLQLFKTTRNVVAKAYFDEITGLENVYHTLKRVWISKIQVYKAEYQRTIRYLVLVWLI